jgi:hypothetical protein
VHRGKRIEAGEGVEDLGVEQSNSWEGFSDDFNEDLDEEE